MTQAAPDPGKNVVLATRNKGKIRELGALLAPFGLDVLGLDAFPGLEDVEETGATFAENALLKACAVSAATGLVALADDSGLEIDALGGAPGVYSARYSAMPGKAATDAGNMQKALAALENVAGPERTARFRCCMAACAPDGNSILAEGAWEGLIAEKEAGDNGFGYDPIFFDQELQRTAAQMSSGEKNARSHRARAVAALMARWPDFWQGFLKKR